MLVTTGIAQTQLLRTERLFYQGSLEVLVGTSKPIRLKVRVLAPRRLQVSTFAKRATPDGRLVDCGCAKRTSIGRLLSQRMNFQRVSLDKPISICAAAAATANNATLASGWCSVPVY